MYKCIERNEAMPLCQKSSKNKYSCPIIAMPIWYLLSKRKDYKVGDQTSHTCPHLHSRKLTLFNTISLPNHLQPSHTVSMPPAIMCIVLTVASFILIPSFLSMNDMKLTFSSSSCPSSILVAISSTCVLAS